MQPNDAAEVGQPVPTWIFVSNVLPQLLTTSEPPRRVVLPRSMRMMFLRPVVIGTAHVLLVPRTFWVPVADGTVPDKPVTYTVPGKLHSAGADDGVAVGVGTDDSVDV
jgi:hypothetical protein